MVFAEPLAATPDGRLLVGAVGNSNGDRGATWDAQSGCASLSTTKPRMESTFPQSMSDDRHSNRPISPGRHGHGSDAMCNSSWNGKAVVCTKQTGAVVQRSDVASVSADGKRIAGSQGNGAYLWDDGKLVAICKPDAPKPQSPLQANQA